MSPGHFYIDGHWLEPAAPTWQTLVDPVTEEPFGRLALGSAADVDRAVVAARRAFPAYSAISVAERMALLRRILQIYERRNEDFAQQVRREMGAPITFARQAQAVRGPAHLKTMISVLERFEFEQRLGTTRVRLEPIGVCGLITPWNWPINQVMPYETDEEAVEIANGTMYGLAAYVQSADIERARRLGRALRAGMVHLNYPPVDFSAPFGGYKRSGNGREWGEAGLREYLETKAIVGYGDD